MARDIFFEKLMSEVAQTLEAKAFAETNLQETAKVNSLYLRGKLESMRTFVQQHPFETEADEIQFFKVDKPALGSKLFYYTKVFQMEKRRPVGSWDLQLQHLHAELLEIDHDFTTHQEFYYYYQSGSTLLDELYFVRGRQDIQLMLDCDWMYNDPSFSTGYDLLVAKVLANEALIPYVENIIRKEEKNERQQDAETASSEGLGAKDADQSVQTTFRGKEIYIFLKALIDSGVIVNHTYKSFFELAVPGIANLQQKSFQASSLLKYSDKIDPESRENVKRVLQKMQRNIDTY